MITEPVQILKELIDNSLDGQSSRICVRIHWDCNWLCVTDNGDGIEVLRSSLLLVAYYSRRDKTEDIPNLAQTASTSKLQSFEKLDQIKTLGFRGEALRSIRTTANLTIRSCTSLGGAFQINFDKGQDESKTRMNDEDVNPLRGTSVYVSGVAADLAFSTADAIETTRSMACPTTEIKRLPAMCVIDCCTSSNASNCPTTRSPSG